MDVALQAPTLPLGRCQGADGDGGSGIEEKPRNASLGSASTCIAADEEGLRFPSIGRRRSTESIGDVTEEAAAARDLQVPPGSDCGASLEEDTSDEIPRVTKVGRLRSMDSIGDISEEAAARGYACSIGRRPSMSNLPEVTEEVEAREQSHPTGRRRSMSNAAEVIEESADVESRAAQSEEDDFDTQAEWADAGVLCEARERTLSDLSIPEERPSTSGGQLDTCRSSSKTLFPSDMERVEDYDPRKPEYIRQATVQEAAAEDHALLLRIVSKLERAVRAREKREPSSEVLRTYRQTIRQMQKKLWRLEVEPRAVLIEQGGLFEESSEVEEEGWEEEVEEDAVPSERVEYRWARSLPAKAAEIPLSPASLRGSMNYKGNAAVGGPTPASGVAQNAEGATLGWLLRQFLEV